MSVLVGMLRPEYTPKPALFSTIIPFGMKVVYDHIKRLRDGNKLSRRFYPHLHGRHQRVVSGHM
jgi:hypothetical protein